MTELVAEIREIAARYPETRSAILPALHLAQERNDGWLPPQALEEVGTALGVTPAYVQSVASFYDMLHLEPVGRHLVEVCTNVSCALNGAQQVVEAFERELGVRPGETIRRRRGDAEDDGVRRRLRLGSGGGRRSPVPRAAQARGRARGRAGASRWVAGNA